MYFVNEILTFSILNTLSLKQKSNVISSLSLFIITLDSYGYDK